MILLALVVSLTASAQILGRDTVGVRLIDSTAVEATYLDFGRPIYDMVAGPQKDYLLVLFRDTNKKKTAWKNKGEIGMVSLSDKKLLWTQPYNYMWPAVRLTSYGVMLSNNAGKVAMLDLQTGVSVWQQEFSIVQVDDSMGVALAYGKGSQHLHGYRLTDGRELWDIKVPHYYNWGWDGVVRVDSTRLLVVNDDVMLFDELTGKNYTYAAKTGVDDVKGALLQGLVAIAGASAGMALGAGYYYMPMIEKNVITKLYADVIRCDSLYYFSDRRNVVCLDSRFQTVWEHELPSKTAARSVLLADDSLLYMLNMGYGLKNWGMPKKMGRPFIAAFDRRTGQQQFMNMLTMRKDMVADAMLTGRGVYMMFDDGLAYKADMRDSVVSITPWNQKEYGRLTSMAHIPVFIGYSLKGTYEPFDFDGQNCLVMTEKGDAYVVNERLDIRERYANRQLYYPVCERGDRVWIYHSYPSKELLQVHQLGLPELRITIAPYVNSFAFRDDRLFLQTTDRLYICDM